MKPQLIPPNISRLMSEKDKKELGVIPQGAKVEIKEERDLQNLCETELLRFGFRRRTPDDIKRQGPMSGWFIHLHNAKKNPIILDLLILFIDGTFLEIELKTKDGVVSDEQKEIVARGGFLCRTFDEFKDVIRIHMNRKTDQEEEEYEARGRS